MHGATIKIIFFIDFFILRFLRTIFIPLYHHNIFLHATVIDIAIHTCPTVKCRMRRSAKLMAMFGGICLRSHFLAFCLTITIVTASTEHHFHNARTNQVL